jgi:membrane peptidoglycan carboxypeptidase
MNPLNNRGNKGAPRRMSPAAFGRVVGGIAVLALLAGLVVTGIAAPLVGLAGIATRDATDTFDALQVPALGQLPSRSEILDASGRLIAYYYPNYIYRVPVSYGQISPDMRAAAVAIEDSRFYDHGAIDIRGTLRALVSDLTGGQVQGGSTLAQQYVKNALILTATNNAERQAAIADDAARKIIELRIAASVEHELTLNQLLAAYLNVAYFENEAYGVQVAAQRYFATTAARLTLPESALLAGLVQNPARYDPLTDPAGAIARRNVVLGRMAQLHDVSQAAAAAAERAPLGLHYSPVTMQQGCYSSSARTAAWFCDYALAEMRTNPAYRQAWQELNSVGGLRIYTTMNEQDQQAAQNAVSFMLPSPPSGFNPGDNAAAEVLIQPGTGAIRAIADDRPYGTAHDEDSIDYAVDTAQNGGIGVQTGSSSKLFTLITALEQDVPFGFSLNITSPDDVDPYYNCRGQDVGGFPVSNAEGPGKGNYTLYTATTQSINVFFAELEQKVGLCNVVKTAVAMGVHRASGQSLLATVGKPGQPGYQLPADDLPSFTLGSVNVSPLSMAGAYATVAAGGIYCKPVAIGRITGASGHALPVAAPDCHRVIPQVVADAATYILRGVLTTGTAKGDSVDYDGVVIPQAGKTGTANGFQFAAFGGYTPRLAGYVSMFNPTDPVMRPMSGDSSCYRSSGGALDCPGAVFGANAGQIWQMTFQDADLGNGIAYFTPPPPGSPLFREGNGQKAAKKS